MKDIEEEMKPVVKSLIRDCIAAFANLRQITSMHVDHGVMKFTEYEKCKVYAAVQELKVALQNFESVFADIPVKKENS